MTIITSHNYKESLSAVIFDPEQKKTLDQVLRICNVIIIQKLSQASATIHGFNGGSRSWSQKS